MTTDANSLDHTLTHAEQRVDIRGLERTLCTWGPDDGPLAVLLHGWLDQGAAWQRVAWRLAARGWRVVAPDHRGHGRTAHAPPGTSYHFAEYVVDLDHLIELLGRPVAALVGHSMGGTIASLYAGLRPEVPLHVVLLEGLGPLHIDPDSAADQLVEHLDAQRRPRPQRPMTDAADAAERLRRLTPSLGAGLSLALAERTTVSAASGGVVWTWDPMHRTRAAIAYDAHRHEAILRRIRAPVDLFIGATSWYRGLPDLQAREGRIPTLRGRHEVPSGHAIHIEAAGAVAALIDTGPGAR